MKVVIATDSFKGSLSTIDAGNAIAEGIKRVYKDAEVIVRPLADGGEGTVESMALENGSLQKVNVHNPLGDIIESSYAIRESTKTAIIEMSAAAGITLIDKKDLNPLNTTTYGVGEIIKDAISKGCRNFIIGIGGSATNDGGVGMLQALGFEFKDKEGNEICQGAKGLETLHTIIVDNAMPTLRECTFRIACDVKNPLCGTTGCSAVYGPQKGATPKMIEDMDNWLKKYAEKTKLINPDANPDTPGAGAAGGMGYAFLSYLNGSLEPGIDLIIEETKLEEYIKSSDIVITGEGRLDGQSYMGKAPVGVAKLAKKYDKTVIAFSGCVTDDARICNEHGIDAFFPIVKGPCSLEDAMDSKTAFSNMADRAEQVFRLIQQVKR